MKLFKYEDFTITISEEALAIKAFSDIWKRDRSKAKVTAIQELGLLYFMYDPRSDYMYLEDTEERWAMILSDVGLPAKYKMDDLLIRASEVYCKLIFTPSSILLVAARSAINKVSEFLASINLDDVDDKGKPKYQVSSVTTAIRQIPALTKDLAAAERAVNSEINEYSKIRGQKQKSMLDDGIGNFMN